ncbi:MAG: hypothetical protein M0R74_06510, partial [Dehalococcoidia bacterium]|nr:hypothetical protein [Dehalococcoidia bacterium]
MGSDYAVSTGASARSRVLQAWPLLVAMRPYQWPKNLLVFAALVFSVGDAWTPGEIGTWWPMLWRTAMLFGLWSMAASATYLFNDTLD